MSKTFSLNQLTEGIRDRNVAAEGQRLIEKWTRTGLLRGLGEQRRESMARLLENQAAQVIRESNSLGSGGSASGDVQGFSNIAFPIVRRVFGGLVANELVSIQPMSLPSGLLFYLDYTYGSDVGGDSAQSGTDQDGDYGMVFRKGESIYGSAPGRAVRSGSLAVGGQYDLAGSTYSKVHGYDLLDTISNFVHSSGTYGSSTSIAGLKAAHATGTDGKLLQYDPQLTRLIEDGTGKYEFLILKTANLANAKNTSVLGTGAPDFTNIKGFSIYEGAGEHSLRGYNEIPDSVQGGNSLNIRRLNQLGTWDGTNFTSNMFADTTASTGAILLVMSASAARISNGGMTAVAAANVALTCSFPLADGLNSSLDNSGGGATLTIPSFESNFANTPAPVIPEIDIKIESIAVTAQTRKLRARWSPELAQDLNAYHSLDPEVELTQILSEQIALEIDREILNDLLMEARGANYYWSRAPGKFVNKQNGSSVDLASSLASGPQFTGTVREWYETLVETIIDVGNEIHRKTLRGSANFIVCSPDVATIFESSVLYKPSLSIDGDGQVGAPFQLGADKIGTLSNRFTVYKDPYFPRNKVLVGYKGGSYLETGYVYAPYVPLIVTPTIFAPEDFTPRKGVMTRYGKKMVRGDFYGTVTCIDMDVI